MTQELKPACSNFYIPHHFVLKEESTTTKFRVVFDASAKLSTGISLNDAMMVGPTLQDNLTEIITRFRCHPIAFTADIAKMYRQINLTEEDKKMHHIFWREDPSEPVREYKLNTVTYGTASAPYLAVRVLQQLAQDEQESLPLASSIAQSDLYVDDLMSGAESDNEAFQIQDQLLELMNRGGLQLRKWSSNSKALLMRLPPNFRETKQSIDDENVDFTAQFDSVKTLGIRWNTVNDNSNFKVHLPPTDGSTYTKRIVL
jgi:hypothetical protein